jgi:hypothetical protein
MVDFGDLSLLTTRGEPITIGDLRSGLESLPAIETAIRDILGGKTSWDDAETIGPDVLAILAIAIPQAAAFIAVAKIALAVAPLLANIAHSDPDPIHDAQLTEGRGGRRGS